MNPHDPPMKSPMDRRRFLGLTGGALAASALYSGVWPGQARAQSQPARGVGSTGERTLIVVDLQGGNDAINTLVPATGRYHDLRPSLALSDDELISFAGLEYGVHPALAPLERLWDSGQMAALYGIGLAGQTRSHFVAQDAWRSARPGEPATSGWLGRWLEATATETEVPLRAISLGGDTLAARGETGRPVAVQSVEAYDLRPPAGDPAVIDALVAMGIEASPDSLLGEAQAALPAAVRSVDELQTIIASVSTGDGVGDFDPDPSTQLFAAAQAIVAADVGTQVIYITIDGFDTHSAQLPRHAELLGAVAGGLDQMFAGLAESGHADRCLALTISEFGRRAQENGSAGTDHGDGGLAFMTGPAVATSAVYGGADLNDLVDGDLAQTIDARSVYEIALDWLSGTRDLLAIQGGVRS